MVMCDKDQQAALTL